MRRRTRLGKFLLGATLALVLPGLAWSAEGANASADDRRVEIAACDFSFVPPPGWVRMEQSSAIDNLTQRLDATREDLATILASHRKALDLISYVQQDPKGYRGIVPTIKVTVLPNEARDFATFKKSIDASLRNQVSDVLRNVRITREPTEISLSGRPVVDFEMQYDLSTTDGSGYRITTDAYAVPCREVFLQITMIQALPAGQRQVFDEFVSSFRLGAADTIRAESSGGAGATR